jgi:hypothetical protein
VTTQQNVEQNGDLPQAIGRPAHNALARASYTRLERLGAAPELEIANLYSVGPKALRLLRGALAERGLSFKQA